MEFFKVKVIREGGIDADMPWIEGTHLDEGKSYQLDKVNAEKWEKRKWIEIEGPWEERAALELDGEPAERGKKGKR